MSDPDPLQWPPPVPPPGSGEPPPTSPPYAAAPHPTGQVPAPSPYATAASHHAGRTPAAPHTPTPHPASLPAPAPYAHGLSGPPPGWHLDHTGSYRWWDGTAWWPAVQPAHQEPRRPKITPPVVSPLATWAGLGLSLGAAGGVAVVVLVVGLLFGGVDASGVDVGDIPTGLFLVLLATSSAAMWAVYTLAFDLARRRNNLSFAHAVGWSNLARMTGIGVLVGILLRWPLAGLELALSGTDQRPELAGLDIAGLSLPLLALFGLVVVVGAPVFEELFFRGLMLPTLSRPWPVWAAVAASSVIFGVLHIGQPLLAVVYITLVGVALAVTRVRTGSLVPCVVAHAVFNGTSFLMAVALY